MADIDWEKVKFELGYLAHADHMGDVNNALPDLCAALHLPPPKWSEIGEHFVMAWDVEQYVQDLVDDGESEEDVRASLYE